MQTGDTIAAISSAVGAAARMIVRVSGPAAQHIHQNVTGESEFIGGQARRSTLRFCEMGVPAWIYFFRGPRSATGEDLVEFHIPGNPLLARLLLDELIRLGARQAEAGEFTARAYFNGRIGLAEAEGVSATIAAQSERELAAARQLLAGELSRRLRPVLDSIAETLALIEVGIDFSEEEITVLSTQQIAERIGSADAALADLLSQSSRFERLSHEPAIVLVGRPNAGKSTLLNALAGHERAVVSSQAGTTRDAIWAHIRLPRGLVRMIDVAGLDESDSGDAIGSQMQLHARRAIEEADLIVVVRDCTDNRPALELDKAPELQLASKSDLNGVARGNELLVSAATGQNLDILRQRLDHAAFGQSSGGATLALNARHVQAIEESRLSLARARQRLADAGPEVLAMELRETLDILGTVLGSVSPDDVLGRIFSTFCIGK